MTYGCAARQYVGQHLVESTTGIQQGDSLSPLLFSLTVHPLVRKFHEECTEMHQGWYLDDGTFVGPRPVVQHSVQLFVDRAQACGLSLNPQKCRVWAPVPNSPHLQGFPVGFVHEHRAAVTVLGAAITLSVE